MKRKRHSAEQIITKLREADAMLAAGWDFIFDSDVRGRCLKWLSIVDEFTRECLALEVERSITSGDVLDALTELMLIRGVPKFIRSDNGPEFIADRIKKHLEHAQVHAGYIEPGSPWENGYAESFHSRLRDELLNAEQFDGVRDAKHHATKWKNDYNHRRPHSSLGYVPPAVFAAAHAKQRVEATPLRLAALASAPCPQHTMKPNPTLITAGT